MKYVKILGLAAVAAMAATALVASSASATTLYSGASTLPAGTELKFSLVPYFTVVTTSSEVLDQCTENGVSGKTAQETAAEITAATSLTWGGCTNTTDTLKGGTIGISSIEGTNNGTVKSYGAEVTVGGIFGTSCVYGTSATGTTLGTLVGSETSNATLEINTPVERKSGGFLCPPSVVWRFKLVLTVPFPFRIGR